MNEHIENIIRESTKIVGSDIHPIDLKSRVDVTPVNDVEWSGLRGQSFCKPTSPEVQEILKKYGQTGVQYSLKADPDFSKVAIATVRISDMTEDMGHDYTSTINKLLTTDFAKNNNISTPGEMRAYIKEHDLTIHEGADGVTEYLIERKIHQTFRHYGGRGKIRGFEEPEMDRIIQTKISQGSVEINKSVVKGSEIIERKVTETQLFIEKSTQKFVSEDLIAMHESGVEEAIKAAEFAAILSITKNTIAVIKNEKEIDEATKDVLVDTASSAALGYVTGSVMEQIGIGHNEAALLITGTVQISKQMIAYVNGEIGEAQFINGVAETSAYLAAAYAGKYIGQAIGNAIAPGIGGYIGQYIGEMITTAICSEVVSTIKYSKEFEKQNKKVVSLYRRAESEIKSSQERLDYIIQKENSELIYSIREGFDEIMKGIQKNSYSQIESGMATIGNRFGLTREELSKDNITRKTLFSRMDDVLEIE